MLGYYISVVIAAAAFWVCYQLLLAHTTMHRFKRWYLLSAVLLSLALPLVTIPVSSTSPGIINATPGYIIAFNEIKLPVVKETPVEQAGTVTVAENKPIDVATVLLVVYLAVALVLLVKVLYKHIALLKYIRTSKQTRFNQYTLHIIEGSQTVFSYWNHICVGEQLLPQLQQLQPALQHEAAHIQQRHSRDILFINCIQAIAWANPFNLLFARSIRLNHEFLADSYVLQQTNDPVSYQHLLLQFATAKAMYPVSALGGLHFSFLKSRFIMMTRKQSPLVAAAVIALVLTCCVMISAFSVNKKQVPAGTPPPIADVIHENDTTQPAPDVIFKRTPPLKDTSELLKQYFAIEQSCTKEIIRNNDTLYLVVSDYATRVKVTRLLAQITKQEKMYINVFARTFLEVYKRTAEAPSQQQYERFKNPDQYGIWIDGHHVSNDKLGNYKYSDFANVFVSKLYGAAKKGRRYNYQVDLETHAYFKKGSTDDKQVHVNSWKRYYAGKKSGFSRGELEHIADSVRSLYPAFIQVVPKNN